MVVPVFIAIATPVATSIAATEGFELLHKPPCVPLLVYVVLLPTQRVVAPLTVPATIFEDTDNDFEAETGLPQPVPTV